MILDINGSFEDGWSDLPPTGNAGWLVNQKPNKWELEILPPGEKLWDSEDIVKGEPECVHKLATQLPDNERPGEVDALILDGTTVYKIFHSGASFGAKLSQTITGLKPGSTATVKVPIRCHRPKSDDDPYEAEFKLTTNGQGGWWNASKMPHRKWVYRTQERVVPDDGVLTVEIYVKSKWPRPTDFFLDNITVNAEVAEPNIPPVDPPEPPTDIESRLLAVESNVEMLNEGLTQAIVSLQTQTEAVITLNNAVKEISQILQELIGGNQHPTTVYGMDVSRYQGMNVDFDRAEDKADFCIIRAGSGRTPHDDNLDYQYNQSISHGMRTGLYWYLYPESPESQAITFADHCERLAETMFAFVDVEQNGLTADIVKRFVDAFESASPFEQKIGIYTRANFWDNLIGDKSWAMYHDLWVAWYTSGSEFKLPTSNQFPSLPDEWVSYKIWQFSSLGGGFFSQVFNNLDTNIFNGNLSTYGKRKQVDTSNRIDLVEYMKGDGRIFEMRHETGQQERQQDQLYNGGWYRVKGENQGVYEKWSYDNDWVYLELDTSPAPINGIKRYYKIFGPNGARMPKCPRYMVSGEKYVGDLHTVQFYSKINCVPLTQNSGVNRNDTQLMSSSPMSFNNMLFTDTVEIKFNGEVDVFAKGYGRIYHYAEHDGEWAISEEFEPGQRPDIKREAIGCLG